MPVVIKGDEHLLTGENICSCSNKTSDKDGGYTETLLCVPHCCSEVLRNIHTSNL